jgi:hypothetical protein
MRHVHTERSVSFNWARVWPGMPYMTSTLMFVNPASAASRTASAACSPVCVRPSVFSSSGWIACTPKEIRLQPALRSFFSAFASAVPGLASTVTSALVVSLKFFCSADSTLPRRLAPKTVGVPPPTYTVSAATPPLLPLPKNFPASPIWRVSALT